MDILFSWIGHQDEKAILNNNWKDCALGSILAHKNYDKLELIVDYRSISKNERQEAKTRTKKIIATLANEFNCEIIAHYISITNPTNFSEIYTAVQAILNNYSSETLSSDSIDFNATSGTPTMQMVWLLFSKTLIGRPLTASRSGDVALQDFPFEIHADFVPEKTKNQIKELAFTQRNEVLKQVTFEQFSEYKNLAFSSEPMIALYKEAVRAGSHEMPVCITGEPGTEKKAIALLIHKESEFSKGPFVKFDFRSVDSYEIDDFLFDTRKMLPGKTVIQRAALGTLYLENIENLRLSVQRKLIEIITKFETELLKSGSKPSDSKKFRFIFSTSANLEDLMRNGTIDEEFYFLISSSRIRVPSIDERADDTPKIAEEMLNKVNKLLRQSVGFGEKKFSEAAIKLIRKRRWPGNIYELYTTIKRAALSTEGPIIMYDDLMDAVINSTKRSQSEHSLLDQRLGEGFDINEVLKEVRRHYVNRALEQANNKKNKAADLLGLVNRQTLTHWLDKFEEEEVSN